MYGDVIESDKPKVVRCELENTVFIEGNESVVEDVDFTIGSSGVFYVGEQKFGGLDVEINRDFVRIDFDYPEGTLIKNVEMSCIYDAGESPFNKIIINLEIVFLVFLFKDIAYNS